MGVRALFVLLSASAAAAMPPTPNLHVDSLIFLSDVVVEYEFADVRGVRQFTPHLRMGSTDVVARLPGAGMPRLDPGLRRPDPRLGDRVYRFFRLDEAGRLRPIDWPGAEDVVVHDGRIYRSDFGIGYTWRKRAGRGDDFVKSFPHAVERVRRIRDRLAGSPERPWLLRTLIEQGSRVLDSEQMDLMTGEILSRLAPVREPDALFRALIARRPDRSPPSFQPATATILVERAFGTPEGRDFLLHVVQNRSTPRQHRLWAAFALDQVGADYRSVTRFTHEDSRVFVGTYRSMDEHARSGTFLARWAHVAHAVRDDEELCYVTTRCFRCADSAFQRQPRSERLHVGRILASVYRDAPSSRVRFEAARACLHLGEESYRALRSPCGDWLARVHGPLDQYGPQAPGIVFLGAELVRVDENGIEPDRVDFEFRHFYGATWTVQRDPCISGGPTRGLYRVRLPTEGPAGEYEVRLRLWHGRTLVSESYPLLLNLPR